ncbi:MAG: hypothetical protein R2856_20860 [Caldilineaceae bacterium]
MWIETGNVCGADDHADGSSDAWIVWPRTGVVIPHPEDGCFIHLTAHTDVRLN